MATKKASPVKKAAAEKASPVKKAAAKVETPKKVEPKKREFEMNAKLADPDGILKAYDALINQLARVESSQRNKSKPFRIYFIHRRKMEVMKMNFIKSMR